MSDDEDKENRNGTNLKEVEEHDLNSDKRLKTSEGSEKLIRKEQEKEIHKDVQLSPPKTRGSKMLAPLVTPSLKHEFSFGIP